MKAKYAIFFNSKVMKIERSAFLGTHGIGFMELHVSLGFQSKGRRVHKLAVTVAPLGQAVNSSLTILFYPITGIDTEDYLSVVGGGGGVHLFVSLRCVYARVSE